MVDYTAVMRKLDINFIIFCRLIQYSIRGDLPPGNESMLGVWI